MAATSPNSAAILVQRKPPAPDGAPCDDGSACTSGDACVDGVCGGQPAPPGEVANTLRVDRNGEIAVITWSSVACSTSSDVLRGNLGFLPVGSANAGEVCLATGLPPSSPEWQDPAIPAPGAGFWYLVRGGNSIGNGSWGSQRNGAPEVSAICP